MSYTIHREQHNGYRCTCCQEHWEWPVLVVESRQEALAKMPRGIPTSNEITGMLTWSVRITDTDGTVVAQGHLEWPPVLSRGMGYTYTRWHGFIEDRTFDLIRQDRPHRNHGGGEYEGYPKEVTDRTWEQILAELQAFHEEQKKEQPPV